MENIYKIKICSNAMPRELYPSERRYSSSIVLGLGVMFLALAGCSTLMGTLVIRRLSSSGINMTEYERFLKRVEEDLTDQQHEHTINFSSLVTAGIFIMSFGEILAGFAGLLASKYWYIDRHITWFFLSSTFSIVTSAISLLIISLSTVDYEFVNEFSTISLELTVNIFIASLLGMIWSVVATKVGYRGMKNNYPDDLVLSKTDRGQVEILSIIFQKMASWPGYFPEKKRTGICLRPKV